MIHRDTYFYYTMGWHGIEQLKTWPVDFWGVGGWGRDWENNFVDYMYTIFSLCRPHISRSFFTKLEFWRETRFTYVVIAAILKIVGLQI